MSPVDITQMVSMNAACPDLASRVEAFNDQLMTVLDKLAPLKTKRHPTNSSMVYGSYYWPEEINEKERKRSGRSTGGMTIGKPSP